MALSEGFATSYERMQPKDRPTSLFIKNAFSNLSVYCNERMVSVLPRLENEWICNDYDTISFGFGELEALELFCEASLDFLVTH